MRSLRIPLLLLAVLLSSAALHAQAPAGKALPCNAETNTASMRNCETVRYMKAEQDMREVYGRVLNRLDESGKTKLNAAQSAWVHFRDANADFAADTARGGTLAMVLRVTTAADMTEQRTAELRKLLH